mmetsp:Transcript_13132/g.27826  ORF Transcript_13132/g.27826 Transcript_13132/m.27826 type:complete len:82 (-) Transcript_13132:1673-1918(-)
MVVGDTVGDLVTGCLVGDLVVGDLVVGDRVGDKVVGELVVGDEVGDLEVGTTPVGADVGAAVGVVDEVKFVDPYVATFMLP